MECAVTSCNRIAEVRGWCAMHYGRWKRHGDPEKIKHHVIFGTVEDRFWPKVDKRGPDECWEWQARRARQGYGQFALDRGGERWTTDVAHRVAWELTHGAIPDGLCICHRCDNPPCCNPGHLFLGTYSANTQDMLAKGRYVVPRTIPERRARGERSGMAKLTDAKVRAIRLEYAAGGISQRELGERHGVAQTVISRVVHRETWAHID